MAEYSGGCACGAVHFETDAEPMMAGHCQCGKCQKLSGAPHSTFAVFPAATVKLSGPLTYWSYTADSGNIATRGHCATCGSPVIVRSSGLKDVVALQVGALDDPSMVTPQMIFFNARAQAWDHMDASLMRFPGMPPM